MDFDNKTLVVNKNIITYYEDIENEEKREKGQRGNKTSMEQDSLKTEEGRVIPLCKTAIEYLNLQRSFAGEEDVQDDDYIVNNSKKIVSATTINHAYVMTCRAAKIENHQGTHTLRHTFASMLIRRKVDIKVVSEILGHKDVAFTYNTYVHIIEEQRASAVNALDEI